MRKSPSPAGSPVIPVVPLEAWRTLYDAADMFVAATPWERVDDEALFGVEEPDGPEVGYGCIMGGGGEFRGFALFRGWDGLSFRLAARMMELLDEAAIQRFAAMRDCLMLEFVPAQELEPADRAIHAALGRQLDSRKRVPVFRSCRALHAPWHLVESETRFLAHALRCALDFVSRLEEDPESPGPQGGRVLQYRRPGPGVRPFARRRMRLASPPPDPVPPPVDELRLARLRKGVQPSDAVWEASAAVTPIVLTDGPRPYIPRAVLVVDARSGVVLATALIIPAQEAALAVQEAVLHAMEESGCFPREVRVDDRDAFRFLKSIAAPLGFRASRRQSLPATEEARSSLFEYLSG